jgi:hypothetical protein
LASTDLTEARSKIDATQAALQVALGGQDDPTIRQAIARLDRIAAEMGMMEISLPVAHDARS